MSRRVLITGGAGFIGSHTCLVLLEQGHELVVLDNFDNSSPEALRRVQELAGSTQLTLVEGDVRDASAVDKAFGSGGAVDGVIHFAGLKAVGESVANPLLYWDVNVNGSRVLAAAMERHGCRTLVFSSTSTAYGEPETFPLREDMPTAPVHRIGSNVSCWPVVSRNWETERQGSPACSSSSRRRGPLWPSDARSWLEDVNSARKGNSCCWISPGVSPWTPPVMKPHAC